MTTKIRPMTNEDLDGVAAVNRAADDQLELRAGNTPEPWSAARTERFQVGMRRFIELDADGAWVAEDAEGVAGMTNAVRRGGFWGLAMLFVHPRAQSKGAGRALLDKAWEYAQGAAVRMIMSSEDPRAIRRYCHTGLSLHPGVLIEGQVDRTALPADLAGRSGSLDDLDLVAAVDASLGRWRQDDAAFLIEHGAALEIVENGAQRGFGVHRDGTIVMLGATDVPTAVAVFWQMLAASGDRPIQHWCLTAGQNWAVRVAVDARLTVKPSGPLFVSGMRPPEPWIPSGWYF